MSADSALAPLLQMQRGNSEPRDDGAWMPGLPTLRAQQNDLVDRLREGFRSRREVLLWTHAVAVVSLGNVPDGWFNELLGDRYRVGALLADQERRDALCKHPPGEDSAGYIRDDIQQHTLSGAFQRARSDIRGNASDFTQQSNTGDPARQRFIAMRPRVHQVAVAQHNAIQQAFDGFHSRREVLDWADYVDYATTGYLPVGFPGMVTSPLSDWWSILTRPSGGRGGAWLESRLAETVLPAANLALRNAMETGTEEPSTVSDMEVPSG